MGKKKYKKEKAKTTENMFVGQNISIKIDGVSILTKITSIFDRWTVGTPFGSRWAEDVTI